MVVASIIGIVIIIGTVAGLGNIYPDVRQLRNPGPMELHDWALRAIFVLSVLAILGFVIWLLAALSQVSMA